MAKANSTGRTISRAAEKSALLMELQNEQDVTLCQAKAICELVAEYEASAMAGEGSYPHAVEYAMRTVQDLIASAQEILARYRQENAA